MRYFEKTALSALKAREMAKSFNIITEPGTAWKWALRNLRKGKDIGKPSEGLVQKLKKLPKKDEYGALYGRDVKKNKLGRIVKGEGPTADIFRTLKNQENFTAVFAKATGDKEHKAIKKFNKKFSEISSIHTHPRGLMRSSHGQLKEQYKIGVKASSDTLKGKGPFSVDRLVKMEKEFNPKVKKLEIIEKLKNRVQENEAGLVRSKYIIKSRIGGAVPSGWDPVKKVPHLDAGQPAGDYGVYKLHSPSKTHTILSENILGLHKLKGEKKLRSVYLKV